MGKGKGAAGEWGTTDGKGGMKITVITIPTMYNKYRAIKMKGKGNLIESVLRLGTI